MSNRHAPSIRITYKLLFGLLGLSGVLTELLVLVDRGKFAPANFFSFFTIESNIFAASILILSAITLIMGNRIKHLDMLRGAAALYMVTTGVVFSILLAGLDSAELTAIPWDNIVLHYIMPIAVFIDWLIDPPQKRISFRRSTIWLIYPVTYVVYSLVRGHLVDWYPYPFLDPDNHGYVGVALTSLGITVGVLSFTWLLLRLKKN